MKALRLSIVFIALSGATGVCKAFSTQQNPVESNNSAEIIPTTQTDCIGSTELPTQFADQFSEIIDEQLLTNALGEPLAGKLCQGKVYQANPNANIVIYRVWNSTNPNSQFGNWWALEKPSGTVADYREKYEICYQWSPLDKLVQCELSPGTKVVIGNGQSVQCSQYLVHGVSSSQQVYIENADQAMINCRVYDGILSWQ